MSDKPDMGGPDGQPALVGRETINVGAGLFCDAGGVTYPITNWFDEDGDECPCEEAVTAVAGKDGCWFALVLADFVEGARA